MSDNLDQAAALLRRDPGFARRTVERNGANLKDWLPPLTKSEIAKAA